MQSNTQAAIYEICVQDFLDPRWLCRYADLEISTRPDGHTIITGVMDQSTLRSIINRILDLGLILIFVVRK
jgi:hypothetical protein